MPPVGAVALRLQEMLQDSKRRAAMEGLVALGVSELVTQSMKPLIGRRRPARGRGGAGPPPRTSSFPSSHAAAAAAFASAGAWRFPAAGLFLVPSALVVSGLRIIKRRHFPTDVVGGVAVGLGCAAAVRLASARGASLGRQGSTSTCAGPVGGTQQSCADERSGFDPCCPLWLQARTQRSDRRDRGIGQPGRQRRDGGERRVPSAPHG